MDFLVPKISGKLYRGVEINDFILQFYFMKQGLFDHRLAAGSVIIKLFYPILEVIGHFTGKNSL